MKFITTFLLAFSCCYVLSAQSAMQKRLEYKRLSLLNKYRGVGYFDSLTGIATVYDNGYTGYIDTNAKLILPLAYDTRDFSDGYGVYHDIDQHSFKVIDRNGTFIKEFRKLNSLHGFKNGLALFSAAAGEEVRYGIMDFNGKVIIKNIYPYLEKISEKYYYVNSNKEGSGIINAAGDTVVQVKYGIDYIDTTDLHFIGSANDIGYAIFDSAGRVKKHWGKEVYPESSYIEGVPYFQRDSLIIIKNQWSSTGAKTALVNLNLDTIVAMGKYNLGTVNEGRVSFSESVKVEKLDNRLTAMQIAKMGFLDTWGKVVIPPSYDFGYYFTEGLCAVRLNNKWGYIDKQGKIVIPIKYDNAFPFHWGYAKVQVKEDFFIIDSRGKIVLKSRAN